MQTYSWHGPITVETTKTSKKPWQSSSHPRWGNYSVCQSQWLMQVPGRAWAMVSSFRAFYFFWLKQGIISHLHVLPQEQRGMDKATDAVLLQPHPCFGSEVICSELKQLGDILLAVPNTARRARHCHTGMSPCTCLVLQDQQLPLVHPRDCWVRSTSSLLTDVPSLESPQKCLGT